MTYTQDQVRQMVRDVGTQEEASKLLGVSPAYVSHVLVGRRAPGPKFLRGLGLRRIVRYETVLDKPEAGSA